MVTQRIPSCDDSLVELGGRCYARGACGDEGQRACALVERFPSCNNKNLVEQNARCVHPACGHLNEHACGAGVRLPSCDDALVEGVNGICVTRGACGAEGQRVCTIADRPAPWCDANLTLSNGTCAHLACGRMGERGCTIGERGLGQACDRGLTEIPGCTGDCRGSSSTCANLSLPLTEPTTGFSALPPDPNDPMRGYADLHVHMFSHLAFGGGVMAGAPYDPIGGVGKALGPDYGTDLDLLSVANTPIPAKCPPLVPHCGRNVLHGNHLPVDDTMGLGTDDATSSYFGAPVFNGWPAWHSTTHQQVYYKWLERAWRGGLRLITMLALNNEFACATSKHRRGAVCNNSMTDIDTQINAAFQFEQWLNGQPGGGWFHIVRSPEEAEQTIKSGKLAVVIGIEVDTLFNCKLKNNCTPATVSAEVDKYYDMGVRHIYPNHDFDGGFAGTALFMDPLGAGNLAIEGDIFHSHPCPGISDKHTLNCNDRGLTALGNALIFKLMDKGMLIDIDHMSAKAIDETITLARGRNYPLMVGHGLFNELYAPTKTRHERMRTADQLAQLKALGSVVSVMTQDELDSDPDCKHSSRTFAKNLNYAAAKMFPAGIPFGSDFNGLAHHVGPRYGDDACGKDARERQAESTRPRLQYPFTIPGFGTFTKQITGQRTFDFNTDGLAHIGLYPDLIADLMLQGVSVEPLMHSAATYVNAWKQAAPAKPLRHGPIPLPTKGGGKSLDVNIR